MGLLLALAVCVDARYAQLVETSSVARVSVSFAKQGQHIFYVTAEGRFADPVMHVLDSNGRQIAMADDGDKDLNPLLSLQLGAGTYTVLIRASGNKTAGSGNLYIDSVLRQRVTFGGAFVGIPPDGVPLRYETTATPGGTFNAQIYSLSANGSINGYADQNGVGFFSRLLSTQGDSRLMITSWWGGRARIVFNDYLSDTDGDGVGARLEERLGSCDNRTTRPVCAGVFNTRDSDRDGLADNLEIFGLDDVAMPLLLPLWGANPAHKDVFIEMHATSSHPMPSRPYEPVQMRSAQLAYAAGAPSDSGNLDGTAGVALHFDVGYPAESSADVALYGNWGGWRFVDTAGANYPYTRDTLSTPLRRGIFRFIQAEGYYGGGQAWFNIQGAGLGALGTAGTATLTHELGHLLGLGHAPLNQSTGVTCGPNYQSLMNYLYAYEAAPHFSLGTNPQVLNPAHVVETTPFLGDTTRLSNQTGYTVFPGGLVDWNRSGAIEPGTMRAAITGHPASCGAFARANAPLFRSPVDPYAETLSIATPKMVRIADRLYLFTVNRGRIEWRSGTLPAGACVNERYDTSCVTAWDASGRVPVLEDVRSFSVALAWDRLVFAAVTGLGNLQTTDVVASRFSIAPAREYEPVETVSTNLWVESEPELVLSRATWLTWSNTPALLLFYTKMYPDDDTSWPTVGHHHAVRGGVYWGWAEAGVVRTTDDHSVKGRFGAGLFNWGDGLGSQLCGMFDTDTYNVRYMCYVPERDRFVDLTPATGFGGDLRVTGKPSIALHYSRDAAGTLVGGDARNAVAVLAMPLGNDRIPYMWSSQGLGVMFPPNAPRAFRGLGEAKDIWNHIEYGSTMALFEDRGMRSLMGSWVGSTRVPTDAGGDQRWLMFHPMVEGIFDANLIDGNDFQMMERLICMGARSDATYCGTRNTWGF